MKKICAKCGIEKDVGEFYKNKTSADGFHGHCKKCIATNRKAYHKANREKIATNQAVYREANREKVDAQNKAYREANRKEIAKRNKAYCEANKKKVAAQQKAYYEANKEKLISLAGEYQRTHRKEINARQNLRRRNDPKLKLNRAISSGIRISLINGSKAGCHWEYLVGYSIDDLKSRLESLFKPGMTWDNQGKWHIDHKTPIAVHNFTDPSHLDFKRCWALSNLQPMWASENMSKGATITEAFQPSLGF